MKELRIYQPIGHGWYEGDGRALLPVAKHFTDAELAAEYWCEWKQHDDWREIAKTHKHYASLVPILLARTLTFERFATLPHALEANDVRE